MRTNLLRSVLALLAALLAAVGFAAGTITVTSPTANDYLGKSNTLRFNITGASVQVKVKAVATAPNGDTSSFDTTVTPDTDGKASGSITLNFNDASQEGAYTIAVTATEVGNTYNTPTPISVTVDVVAPKFIELSPVNNGFAKGIIKVRASVEETNVKNWRVQVNSQDIPNGTGEGNTISVDYDPANLTADATLSIKIEVTDEANNSTSKTISVTLDRIRPTVQIVYPSTSTSLSKGQDVSVIIDVTDASSTSVDRTGIDVIAKGTDGSYITRVTFVSLKATSGGTQRWTGRIKYKKGLLPTRFVISATALDRAGNLSTLQEVTVKYGK